VDACPIYMKEEVSLEGNAREIFEKISHIIFERMIPRFWEEHLEPKEQQGEPIFFKRRTPQESELKPGQSLIEIYDYIRKEYVYDKAGSYAIQGSFCAYISKINGDYYNVVGLPICRVYQELKEFEHEIQ